MKKVSNGGSVGEMKEQPKRFFTGPAFGGMEITEFGLWSDDEPEKAAPAPEAEEKEGKEEGPGFSPCSAEDAFVRSLCDRGGIDLPYMAEISGTSVEKLIRLFGGKKMWLDPYEYIQSGQIDRGWKTAQQYLNGQNAYLLLKVAVASSKKYDGLFDDNIRLIRKNMKDLLAPSDVYVSLGATWVPPEYVEKFVEELLNLSYAPSVFHIDEVGKWHVESNFSSAAVQNIFTYGTHYLPAVKIIEKTMNSQPIVVNDYVVGADGKKQAIPNKEKTLEAREKQKLILERWQQFVHGDKKREEELRDIYCEKYGYLSVGYDGSYLSFKDMNPAFCLHPHQKNAVARCLMSKSTLLAHTVGSGKTYIIVAAVHELSRVGLSKKNLVVSPNAHVLEETVRIHRQLYPQDELLVIRPSDFARAFRQELMEDIRDGSYTAIYMASSSFDLIPMSRRYYIAEKEKEIRLCRQAESAADKWSERMALKSREKQLNKQLNKFLFETEDPEFMPYDDLGIETLVIDEAHLYKNISLGAFSDNVIGMHNKGSQKSDSALEKVHFTKKNGGKAILATGTPLVNSLSDLFVLQEFLQPGELRTLGISRFEEWTNTFCERDTHFEIDVDSQNFRLMTRLNKFKNLPELMGLVASFCDFYQLDGEAAALPEFNGYRNTTLNRSAEQKAYMSELVTRVEDIRGRKVPPTEDNLLKCTVDGRKCALDIRLVSGEAMAEGTTSEGADLEGAASQEPASQEALPEGADERKENEDRNKVTACADNAFRVYEAYPGTTQIIFCDTSTPKEDFNIYDECKRLLLEKGVPARHIAFVHDASKGQERDRLMNAFNRGDIRILIGSTQKLGVGTNVQEHLIAVHHLDVPWRPADMTQREGRLMRQGNRNKEVFVFRYVTKGSFDGYIYQLLESKQRFISEFLSGTMDQSRREIRDVGDAVLDYSEMKALATENPLIRTRIETSNALEYALTARNQRSKELLSLREVREAMPRRIEKLKKQRELVEKDRSFYEATRETMPVRQREILGNLLLEALKSNGGRHEERLFGAYQGFDIFLPRDMEDKKPYILMKRKNGGSYRVRMENARPQGVCQRMDHVLTHFEERAQKLTMDIKNLEKEIREAQDELDKGNPFEEQANDLRRRLDETDRLLAAI